MSATLNPKMRQAFALAHVVPFRKDKKAIAHKLVEVLCEVIRTSQIGGRDMKLVVTGRQIAMVVHRALPNEIPLVISRPQAGYRNG